MLTREKVIALSNDLDVAIEKVCKRHKILAGKVTIRYGIDSFKAKFEGNIQDKSKLTSFDESNFKKLAKSYGLMPEHYGKVIVLGGSHYKLLGINAKNRKYPIIAEKLSTGTKFKLPIMDVVAQLNTKKKKVS